MAIAPPIADDTTIVTTMTFVIDLAMYSKNSVSISHFLSSHEGREYQQGCQRQNEPTDDHDLNRGPD